jgi:hypothetical protein
VTTADVTGVEVSIGRLPGRSSALALTFGGVIVNSAANALPFVAAAAAGTSRHLLSQAASPAATPPRILRRRLGRIRPDPARQRPPERLLSPISAFTRPRTIQASMQRELVTGIDSQAERTP